jgi:hypothetical protein
MILPGQRSSHKTRDREPDKTLIELGPAHKGYLANKCTLGFPSSMAMSSENDQYENDG